MRGDFLKLSGICLAVLALVSCQGTVQDRFGLSKRAPDEFQVIRRAPLVIPPDYNLRPPGDGSDAPSVATPSQEARELLTGEPQITIEEQSPVETALLELTPVEAMPGIRERILEESTELVQLDEDRFLFILDFQRSGLQSTPSVVDPIEESQRLVDAGIPIRVSTQRLGTETFVTRPGVISEGSES